jgi:hypothetical protein
MSRDETITGIDIGRTTHRRMGICEDCIQAKMTDKFSKTNRTRATRPGQLIHTDICIMPVESDLGDKCFVLFSDDLSGFTELKTLKKRSELSECLVEYARRVNTKFGRHVEIFRSDNEYRTIMLEEFCKDAGIEQQFTVPYNSDQNGVAERKIRTLMNSARALIVSAEPDISMADWIHAVHCANYVQNRTVSRTALNGKTPFEEWTGRKPDARHLRIFGCRALVYMNRKRPGYNKLQKRAIKCIFVGYASDQKGYLFIDASGRILVSNNAVFDEVQFLERRRKARHTIDQQDTETEKEDPQGEKDPIDDTPMKEGSTESERETESELEANIQIPKLKITFGDLRQHVEKENTSESQDRGEIPSRKDRGEIPSRKDDRGEIPSRKDRGENPSRKDRGEIPSRKDRGEIPSRKDRGEIPSRKDRGEIPSRKDRGEIPSRKYESSGSKAFSSEMMNQIEKVMYARNIDLSDHEMHVEIVYGKDLPMVSIMHSNSDMEIPSENTILSYAMSAVESVNPDEADPKTYREAMSSENAVLWKKALQDEYNSLIENGTWSELKDLPQGRKALGSKWVFSTKRSGLNVIERYKARNVVQGFRQVKGFDYEETFAPVANQASVKILMTIAATLDLELIQYDIKTAFLHGDIDIPEIYIKQPEGFIKPGMENKVFELLKSQYGIKQASRIWNIMLHKSLIKAGLKQSRRDPCLYYKFDKEETTIASIYVDDLNFATNAGHKYFELIKADGINIQKVSGDQYLGVRIERNRGSRTIMMSQQAYIERALDKFGMKDCSTVNTPIASDMKLTEKMCPVTKDDIWKMKDKPYRELIGTINFLSTTTRPDIAKAVSNVSRYLMNPGILHWNAAQRILRYLKRTKDYKLILGGNHPLKLRAFSDADWAGDLNKRRSTTGYVIKLGNSLIAWKSRLQTTTASSTTEAEYYAVGDTLKEILYLLPIMDDLNMPQSFPIIIDEDNQGCIAVSKNMINTSRSKHIDIKYHFIREHVEDGIISLEYCPTGNMQADILTKGLAEPQHANLTSLLGLKRITTSENALWIGELEHQSGVARIASRESSRAKDPKHVSWDPKI